MSRKLDDELARAIREDSGGAATAAQPAAPPGRTERPARSLRLLLTLLAMVGAVVALFLFGFKDAAIYAMPVADLVTAKEKLVGRKVRVEGELVPGTLVKRDSPCEYRFTVHGGTTEMPVRYAQCVIPDTFRDVPAGGVQVTVEGALGANGDFEATLVMAKCTSKYDPATHQMSETSNLPVN